MDYAISNNISVQQMAIRSENQAISLNTAKNSRLPNLSAGLGANLSFGRGESREGTTVDNTTLSTNASANAGITVFDGLRITHTIAGRSLDFQASLQDMERAKEDVSLNVMSRYLEVLLNKELVVVAEKQLTLSTEQLKRSEDMVSGGKSPESVIFESKAIVARDEMNLIQSRNTLQLSLLDLAQALNLENKEKFDILTPDFTVFSMESTSLLADPNSVYEYSLTHRPRLEAERIRLESSRKSLQVAKSAFYPSISMGAGYGNGYYHAFTDGASNKQFFDQLKNNGRESINLNISIPIFNRLSTRNSVRTAHNNIRTQELALAELELNLRKEIEQSYFSADAALRKYMAAEKSYEAAKEAFRYEDIKADPMIGRSTLYEYNEAKNRMEKSESDMIQAKYEFIFRSKILDFYNGKPLEFSKY